MKSSKTLTLLKPAIVLTAICMAAALLLAVVNRFAAPVIEKAEKEKQLATLSVVLPDAKAFEQIGTEGAKNTIAAAYKETTGQGYVFLCSANTGYHTITFSIGIDEDGAIAGIKITSVFYSAGDSGKEGVIKDLVDSYVGQTDAENGKILTGVATKSSEVMKAAIEDVFSYHAALKGGA